MFEHTAIWAITAAVIGGLLWVLNKRILSRWPRVTDATLYKHVVLPCLPLALGVAAALLVPGIIEEGSTALRVIYGLAAGLAASWVYDKWRDFWKGRNG